MIYNFFFKQLSAFNVAFPACQTGLVNCLRLNFLVAESHFLNQIYGPWHHDKERGTLRSIPHQTRLYFGLFVKTFDTSH